ncbi:transmembrane protein 127-like [Glandiceps talaboti]
MPFTFQSMSRRYGRLNSFESLPRSRRIRPKQRERNIVAAILGMIAIATLATALAEPRWFYLHGTKCEYTYIGLYMFFSINSGNDLIMELCVTPDAVKILQAVISLCFISIAVSLFAFILDTFGPTTYYLKLIRRHAVGNIIAVILCAAINGFCYWVTALLEENIREHENLKKAPTSLVEVKFDIGFYLIAGAGGLSVIVVATNMLRRYPMCDDNGDDGRSDWENEFTDLPPTFAQSEASVQNLPAPPAYAP